MATLTIGKFERYERDGDSSALVIIDGKPAGSITGSSVNVGSLMLPRIAITEYTVDIELGGVDILRDFPTRGAAKAFVRGLCKGSAR